MYIQSPLVERAEVILFFPGCTLLYYAHVLIFVRKTLGQHLILYFDLALQPRVFALCICLYRVFNRLNLLFVSQVALFLKVDEVQMRQQS